MTRNPHPQSQFLNSHDVSMRLFSFGLDRKHYSIERLVAVLNDGPNRIVGGDVDERSRAAGRVYREEDIVVFAAAFVLKDLHRWKAEWLREVFSADPDVSPWILENAMQASSVKPGFRISLDSEAATEIPPAIVSSPRTEEWSPRDRLAAIRSAIRRKERTI